MENDVLGLKEADAWCLWNLLGPFMHLEEMKGHHFLFPLRSRRKSLKKEPGFRRLGESSRDTFMCPNRVRAPQLYLTS